MPSGNASLVSQRTRRGYDDATACYEPLPALGRAEPLATVAGVSTRLTTPRFVVVVALLAAAFRLPSALFPLSPDEAGFLLVARHWSPSPISVYGPYFVDRPPELIALIRLSDAIGGPYFLRVIGGLAAFVLVIAAGRAGWLIGGDRAARWSAVVAGSLGSTMMLEAVHAKGEILGAAVVATGFVATLEAVRRPGRSGLVLAFAAGVAATTALGLKQNMVGGLVFGTVVLVGSALTGRIAWRRFTAYAAAALAGAAVPLAVTAAWAIWANVDLARVWYVTFGFRAIANRVITATSVSAPLERAGTLVVLSVLTGIAALALLALLRARRIWRVDRVLTVAALSVFAVDLLGLVLGGSYWPPYLVVPVPGLALLTVLLAAACEEPSGRAPKAWRRLAQGAVAFTAVSATLNLIGGLVWFGVLGTPIATDDLGEAIYEAAEPGDTITVYGGRAEIVLRSGLEAPYPYLWSLPMRVEDPELVRLRSLMAGPRRPTWFVLAVPLHAWDLTGSSDIRRLIAQFYRPLGSACGKPVFLATTAVRPPLRCG